MQRGVTAGIYGDRWKTEGSIFAGREPDEHRTDFDFAPLDSWSGRMWFLLTKTIRPSDETDSMASMK